MLGDRTYISFYSGVCQREKPRFRNRHRRFKIVLYFSFAQTVLKNDDGAFGKLVHKLLLGCSFLFPCRIREEKFLIFEF